MCDVDKIYLYLFVHFLHFCIQVNSHSIQLVDE